MIFYIDIQHIMQEKRSLFVASNTFSVKVQSIAIMSEEGSSCFIKNKSLNAIRKRLLLFIEDSIEIAQKHREKIQFIVYRDPTAVTIIRDFLLGHEIAFQIWDMFDDLTELASHFEDDHFSAESDYTVYIIKDPFSAYSLNQKVEMICSHITFPDWQNEDPESVCKWMLDAYAEYKPLLLHMYMRGFDAIKNNIHRGNGNK